MKFRGLYTFLVIVFAIFVAVAGCTYAKKYMRNYVNGNDEETTRYDLGIHEEQSEDLEESSSDQG